MWPHLVKQCSINGYVAANHHTAMHHATDKSGCATWFKYNFTCKFKPWQEVPEIQVSNAWHLRSDISALQPWDSRHLNFWQIHGTNCAPLTASTDGITWTPWLIANLDWQGSNSLVMVYEVIYVYASIHSLWNYVAHRELFSDIWRVIWLRSPRLPSIYPA